MAERVIGELSGSSGNNPAKIDSSPHTKRRTIPIRLMLDKSLDHIVIPSAKPPIPTDISAIQMR